jgi:hypothetical protein
MFFLNCVDYIAMPKYSVTRIDLGRRRHARLQTEMGMQYWGRLGADVTAI